MTRRITLMNSVDGRQEQLPEPGDIVGGKYRVERTLGIGGMGAVFEVTHCVTHKRFAIKWLLASEHDSQQNIRRFVREAQIAGRIDHPNVVQVYDIYQEETGFFLVMELLAGESLSQRLTRVGRFSVREACRIMVASMEGVIAAHAAGVVHRDLKPANIFLCTARSGELEQPKVLDFGVSRFADAPSLTDESTTRSGAVVGTPYYMAPEQMRGMPPDARVDVYALGVSLYELLAGVRPYDGVTYAELIMKVAKGDAIPLDSVVREVPRDLSSIVARAMHVERDARFATVEDFRAALQPFAAGEVSAGPSVRDLVAPGKRWKLAAAAVVLSLLLGAGVWWSSRHPPADPTAVVPETHTDANAIQTANQPAAVPSIAPQAAVPEPALSAPPAPVQPPAATELEAAERDLRPASPPAQPKSRPVLQRPRPERVESPAATEAPPPPKPVQPPARPAEERPKLHLDREGF